jgi:hypothetical protein
MLGFILVTGKPLCCTIIYSSQVEDVDMAFRMGIKPWWEINRELVTDIEANIMSSLCTLMLTFIDENTKFGQTESTPMLLLDGHGSSFESVFLKKKDFKCI